MVVAYIAQTVLQQQNPKVLSLANQILEPLYGALTHNMSNSFVESACWADDIKNYNFQAFSNWHFLDRPYNPDGFLNATGPNQNIIWAIDQVLFTLGKKSYQTSILENSIAMRLLIHFVGDYHQPLHISTL